MRLFLPVLIFILGIKPLQAAPPQDADADANANYQNEAVQAAPQNSQNPRPGQDSAPNQGQENSTPPVDMLRPEADTPAQGQAQNQNQMPGNAIQGQQYPDQGQQDPAQVQRQNQNQERQRLMQGQQNPNPRQQNSNPGQQGVDQEQVVRPSQAQPNPASSQPLPRANQAQDPVPQNSPQAPAVPVIPSPPPGAPAPPPPEESTTQAPPSGPKSPQQRAYESDMQTRWKAAADAITRLGTRGETLQGKTGKAFRESLRTASGNRSIARTKLNQLVRSSSADFDKLKVGVESAFKDLDSSIMRVQSHFDKPPTP